MCGESAGCATPPPPDANKKEDRAGPAQILFAPFIGASQAPQPPPRLAANLAPERGCVNPERAFSAGAPEDEPPPAPGAGGGPP
jgi:hypothetical protein